MSASSQKPKLCRLVQCYWRRNWAGHPFDGQFEKTDLCERLERDEAKILFVLLSRTLNRAWRWRGRRRNWHCTHLRPNVTKAGIIIFHSIAAVRNRICHDASFNCFNFNFPLRGADTLPLSPTLSKKPTTVHGPILVEGRGPSRVFGARLRPDPMTLR